MTRTRSYAILKDVIERRIKERERANRRTPRPALTITRSTGCGALTIASELGTYLDARLEVGEPPWTVLDRELINRVLEDHALPQQLAQYYPEDKVSTISDAIAEMIGLHPSRWTFVQQTTATVRNLCRMGHVIVVGQGSNIMAGDLPDVLHVRLVGSMRKRIARIRDEWDLTRDEAVEHIRSSDRARASFVKQHFDKNVDDPLLHHLVVNTDRLTDTALVRLVGDAVFRSRGFGSDGMMVGGKQDSRPLPERVNGYPNRNMD